jgi:hypothetical protein
MKRVQRLSSVLLFLALGFQVFAAGTRETRAPSLDPAAKFTVAVIPDTQNYCDYRYQKSAPPSGLSTRRTSCTGSSTG